MADLLDFTSEARDPDKVRTPFMLDGEQMLAVRPKMAALMNIIRGLDLSGGTPTDATFLDKIDEWVDVCMDERTAARLRERMEDPDDGFDYETLIKIVETLQGVWFERPTGPRSASSAPRPTRKSGPRSTGTVRSAG